MNSEIPEVVCDASCELVIKRPSAVQVMNLKVTLEIRQLRPPSYKNSQSFWKPFIKMSGYQEKKETNLTLWGASWPE